ncbi:hypothetical protein ACWGN9_23170 [Streptomyces sp. NPDC055775]
MMPAERRALLGGEIIAYIEARVEEASEPPDEVVEALRRILGPVVAHLPLSASGPL